MPVNEVNKKIDKIKNIYDKFAKKVCRKMNKKFILIENYRYILLKSSSVDMQLKK